MRAGRLPKKLGRIAAWPKGMQCTACNIHTDTDTDTDTGEGERERERARQRERERLIRNETIAEPGDLSEEEEVES